MSELLTMKIKTNFNAVQGLYDRLDLAISQLEPTPANKARAVFEKLWYLGVLTHEITTTEKDADSNHYLRVSLYPSSHFITFAQQVLNGYFFEKTKEL